MSSSEASRPGWKLKALACVVGLGLLAGCQVRPLYGSMNGQHHSVSVSQAQSRAEQTVRNELVLGFGGEQPNADYQLDLSVSSSIGGILPGGVDNEFSAARATVTASYVLKSKATGEIVKSGSRFADAQLDLPSQHFAQERAKLEATDRAAHTVAALVMADVAAALSR